MKEHATLSSKWEGVLSKSFFSPEVSLEDALMV